MLWERERQMWEQIIPPCDEAKYGNAVCQEHREGRVQPGREDRCGPQEGFSEKGLLSWTSWEKKEW